MKIYRKVIKTFIIQILVLYSIHLYAQKPEEFGFRHLQMNYEDGLVDILIKSKKGEEHFKKPLFLFCQGSLPIPLIITYNDNGTIGIYNPFVFNTDSLCKDYHLAIISKPSVPLIAAENSLSKNLTVADSLGNFSKEYTKKNLLSYYVNRNIEVIKWLQKQDFIARSKLVVAGHSEGSTIAANIAFKHKETTHLIYSAGSPLGRIMSIIGRERFQQAKDSTINLTETFNHWSKTVANKNNDDSTGDTYKGLYQFSYPPPVNILLKLKIPVLVTYGTKDYGAIAQNDYLRVATISNENKNFTFKDYIGWDHNFFPLLENGLPNYDRFNWDIVAEDWRKWLLVK